MEELGESRNELDDELEDEIGMVTIEKAIEYNKLAEKIFGYDTTKF